MPEQTPLQTLVDTLPQTGRRQPCHRRPHGHVGEKHTANPDHGRESKTK